MTVFEGRFTDAGGLRIAVVVARFNDLVTGKLLSGCRGKNPQNFCGLSKMTILPNHP